MQKVINVLALTSFGVSAVIVGSGAWAYANRFAILNDVKEIAAKEIEDVVPGLIQNALGGTFNGGGSALPGGLGEKGGSETPSVIPALPF